MEEKVGFKFLLLSVGTVAILLNWLWVRLWGFPFLYCWGGYIAAPLYKSLGLISLYATIAYILWFLMRGNGVKAMVGACVFTAIVELPLMADLAFRAGGSCNG
jgi:hypothetical protein